MVYTRSNVLKFVLLLVYVN